MATGERRSRKVYATSLKTARVKNRPWQQELNRFLLRYRTAPHRSTQVPPAGLLFNRTVKGKTSGDGETESITQPTQDSKDE